MLPTSGAHQAMNWLMDLSWLVGPVLQMCLLACMVHRKLHTVFPRFFSYILFQILKSALLFLTYRYYDAGYFEAYWTGNAISVILAVTVMDEILHKLFTNMEMRGSFRLELSGPARSAGTGFQNP